MLRKGKTMKRPLSISIIAWILIVLSGLSVFSTVYMMASNNPTMKSAMELSKLPVPVQYASMIIGIIIGISCGIGMLKGLNWSRMIYAVWAIFSMILGLVTSPMKVSMIPSLIIFAVILFFLFRPAATEWFTGSQSQTVDPQPYDV